MLQFQSGGQPIKSLHCIGTIPGVQIIEASAINGPGSGSVIVNSDGISWQAPGSNTPGTAIPADIAADGVIADGENPDAWIRVGVFLESLPAAAASQVLLGDVFDNALAGPDCDAAAAASGQSLTWSIELVNLDEAYDATEVTVSFDVGSLSGGLGFEFSLDGTTWSVSPLTVGTMVTGGSVTIYLRRQVPIDESPQSSLAVQIEASFYVAGGSVPQNVACRGLWRIFGPACYRIYATRGRPPVPGTPPWSTAASLPWTAGVSLPDGVWCFSLSYFDGVLDSGFLALGPDGETCLALDIGGGGPVTAPAEPFFASLVWNGGYATLLAEYSDDPAVYGSQWAIQYAIAGGSPTEVDQDLAASANLAVLEYALPAIAAGDVVKARVAVRRNDGTSGSPVWTYSPFSDWQTLTIPEPLAAPRGADDSEALLAPS